MSNQMKILSGVLGALVLAAVVLTMFGKPPNLPLGPLQGMLAKDEAATTEAAATDTFDAGVVTDPDCIEEGALGATDPAASGAAGAVTDSAATGTADGAAIDPTTGAPVAAPAEGWDGDARVTAASAGSYDASRVSDTRIVAADATIDPATGLPADAAATGTSGTAGAAGGATTPAAGGGSLDPAADAAATDPALGTGVVDPCAETGTTDPLAGGAATDPLAGGGASTPATSTGAGTGTGAAGSGAAAASAIAPKATTDGSSAGNNAEALRAAKDATNVMQKAKITVTTTATLQPSVGGVGRAAALKRYRRSVTGAVLVIKLDTAAQQQWTSAGKKVQIDLIRSFIKRLGKSYPKASRSITVVDSAGTVLAIGDATPGAAGTVKPF